MDLMAVGRVRTSHGLTGEVKVLSFSGQTEHFARFSEVWLERAEKKTRFAVEAVRILHEMTLVKLKGLDGPEAAKAWADSVIWVPREAANPLEPGEVYLSDLAGWSVVFEGKVLGTIVGYLEGGAADLLEVKLDSGERRVLPFQDRYIGDLDAVRRELPLRVDWILE